MWSNVFGEAFRIITFGESHGPAVGAVVDGVMPGLELSQDDIQTEMSRRRPGRGDLVSPRREPDRVEVLSGVFEGRTTGAPICILVRTRDARTGDYEALRDVFRPGHADFTWLKKYGIRDWRGGGRVSGRETVARVAAGAVARRLLAREGVRIWGCTIEVAGIRAVTRDETVVESNPMRCPDPSAADAMARAVREASLAGDSVGGVVEVSARGVPAGWGDPVFFKLDALLAQAMMSIGGVKGVEIGSGFAAARMKGSGHNDPFGPDGPLTNHAGGVLGGISTGAPVIVRLAVKPTSSIARPQRTVDVLGRERVVEVRGRHDPCLCPRIVPVAEAMMAIVLADACLRQRAITRAGASTEEVRAALALADAELAHALKRRMSLSAAAGNDGAGRGTGRRGSLCAGVRAGWERAAREARIDREVARRVWEILEHGTAGKDRPPDHRHR